MVLMSAATGGAARRVFLVDDIRIVTTDHTLAEAIEKLPILIDRYGLDPDDVTDALAILPLQVYALAEYESHLPKAMEQIGGRDAKDAALLALALALGIPVWSQDKDFDTTHVARFTTGQLLALRGE
ncbi:MAG: PIN domain-containing protein [Thermoanaerobaculia bacterium]